jgi:succinate-semialdehyde dehydrogenase/glutarate-semialdehyde dehydrogenase
MFTTTNPATNETIREWREHDSSKIEAMLEKASSGYAEWRRTTFARRAALMLAVADRLEAEAPELAVVMAREMGKPIKDGEAEAKKCALVCRYYAENAERLLAPVDAPSDASESFVRHDPLGPILAIMPWNYPFWQVFRFAAPTLMAGNVALLKHASNVPECALAIERIFLERGFPDYAFQTMLISVAATRDVIADRRTRGVTLTGSTFAGRKVAEAAGQHLKPMVLELGGSDPFIVLGDADVEEAAQVGATARLLNSGQSCVAAKRFIVVDSIHDAFVERFAAAMTSRAMDDPLKRVTDIGPQARADLRDRLAEQVAKSLRAGARAVCGGAAPDRAGAWYPPTVLVDVEEGMPAADEELFGPVASVIRARDEAHAIAIANQTEYGLGASLWTEDRERARRLVPEIEAGAVFVNGLVKSDPRLPFGGIKDSGFGRELGREGILAFMNAKTVWMK